MTQHVRDVMTLNPVTLPADSTVIEAAQKMRDASIGDVLVEKDGRLCGIVTDRDLVVRCLANDKDVHAAKLEQLCTQNIVSVKPDDDVDKVLELMRERAIRRVPVLDDGHAVGIVSLGDLAIQRDPSSVLGEISKAAPKN